jgi:ribonucleoside-diphosphate reductase alpha chain
MRMLDNVIDINYYAVKKARDSNLRHRPVGLGIMGFQDCLYQLRVPYASQPRRSSSPTARWKPSATTPTGPPPNWPPSAAATPATAAACGTAASCRWTRWTCWPSSAAAMWKWTALHPGLGRPACAHRRARHAQLQLRGHRADRHHLQHHRRRRVIEPSFGNLSVKSNLSGEFTVVNEYLVRDLKALGLWDDVMVMDLKHFDGTAPHRPRARGLKAPLRHRLRGRPAVAGRGRRAAPEVDRPGAVLNIYMAGASGKKLDETYKLAWLRGLKTTYYLRTTSSWAPTATSPHPSAASSCCARPSKKPSTPTPTSTSSKAWAWTKARSSTPTTRFPRSATRTSS